MYKGIKLRSKAEYLTVSAGIAKGFTESMYHPDRIHEFFATLTFDVVAVVSCGQHTDLKESNLVSTAQWLAENAVGQYFVDPVERSGIGYRVLFGDEGDAFRFAWSRDKG